MDNKDSNSDNVEQQAKIKRLLKIFWATEAALAVATIQRLFNPNWSIIIATSLAAILMLPVYFLAKNGKTDLASNILLLLLTVLLLGFVWTFGGLRDEVLLVFPAIIMVSLLIGSNRLALYIYLLVGTNILAIGYFNEIGYIHNISDDSNIESAILLTTILTFISYVAWLISAEMNKTNRELLVTKNILEQRVKERTADLETSIENLTNTQEQLIQTEKMASLGRLVAGVAHEINTPIGIAITASSYLQDTTKNFSQLYDNNKISKQLLARHIDTTIDSTKLIRSNLKRAADLIQGFKEVAVDQTSDEVREFDLKHYLDEILASLHPKIKQSQCQVELTCPASLSIKTSPGAIAQIITNLVINAITHAFEDNLNGLITINVESKEEHIHLTFKDSGCGMTPENSTNIFEPFFTTKRGKGGSGLGMHIVYNLVNQSLQGSIECTSTLGKGTSFYIRFPCNLKATLP